MKDIRDIRFELSPIEIAIIVVITLIGAALVYWAVSPILPYLMSIPVHPSPVIKFMAG